MPDSRYAAIKTGLHIDCARCSGLCCTALYCMKTDGFPATRAAGTPCRHLQPDFQCGIHAKLADKKLRGCLAYDCFGAGQKVTRLYGPGMNWKSSPAKAPEIFQVFLTVFRLHQMEWYLLEALSLVAGDRGGPATEIEALIAENERMTGDPAACLHADIEAYRGRVNRLLKEAGGRLLSDPAEAAAPTDYIGKNFKGENLDGRDLSMALLIAADLEGCSLRGTSFLGTDTRDANIRNTDLSASLFLTQMQINAAKGNARTKLPADICRPASWRE